MLSYVHVTKNRGKASRFAEHHWDPSSMSYAFHPTTFFQLGVYKFHYLIEHTGHAGKLRKE